MTLTHIMKRGYTIMADWCPWRSGTGLPLDAACIPSSRARLPSCFLATAALTVKRLFAGMFPCVTPVQERLDHCIAVLYGGGGWPSPGASLNAMTLRRWWEKCRRGLRRLKRLTSLGVTLQPFVERGSRDAQEFRRNGLIAIRAPQGLAGLQIAYVPERREFLRERHFLMHRRRRGLALAVFANVGAKDLHGQDTGAVQADGVEHKRFQFADVSREVIGPEQVEEFLWRCGLPLPKGLRGYIEEPVG